MVEDCLKEVRADLRTNLAAAFDVEDAEYAAADVTEFGAGHAIVLRDVDDDNIRLQRFTNEKIVSVPAILLLPQAVEYIPWMTNVVHVKHTVEVVIVVADTDPEKVGRRLFRSVEAIRRVLTEFVEGTTGVVEDPVFSVGVIDVNYEHEEAIIQPFGLVKAAAMTVVLEEVEDRP